VAAAIDLLIPGLFGPVPVVPGDVPRLVALELTLARADVSVDGGSDPSEILLARFGIAATADGDLPSAPLARLGDAPGADPEGFWLHADPVHLRADRDQLLLFDSRHLGITRAEADALVGLFNDHFANEGLRLEGPLASRWYLGAETPPAIRTRPLHLAVGRNLALFVPTGPDARRWARVLNETQMLFHGAEVNQRREAQGRPVINSVWPWGGGRLPPRLPPGGYQGVYADHPLALGLARAAGLPAFPLARLTEAPVAASGDLLVFWDDLWGPLLDADPGTWIAGVERLERVLADWLAELRQGHIERLSLDPCSGQRFDLTRSGLRRFWRRPAPIAPRPRPPGQR
jgi:hypothetical protein